MTLSALRCTTLILASLLTLGPPVAGQTRVPNLPAGVTLPAPEFDSANEFRDPKQRERVLDVEKRLGAAVEAASDDEALTHLLWLWQNAAHSGRTRWQAAARQTAARSQRARATLAAIRDSQVPDPSMTVFASDSDRIRMEDWYWLSVALSDESGAMRWFAQAVRTPQRNIALAFAAMNNLTDVVSLALQNSANVNAPVANGITPFMYAAGHPRNSSQLVQLMLPAGPNVNMTDGNGRTPLMWAVIFPSIETITALLERGAEPRWRDRRGQTALDLLKGDIRTAGNPVAQQAVQLLQNAEAQRNGQTTPTGPASAVAVATPAPSRPSGATQAGVTTLPAGVTLPAREFDPVTEFSDPRVRERIAESERAFTAAVQARKDDEALTHVLWWWQNTTHAGRARWTAPAKALAARSARARDTFMALRAASVPDPSMTVFADGFDTVRMNDWYWLHGVLDDEAAAIQWFTQAARTSQQNLVLGFATLNNLPAIMKMALQAGANVDARVMFSGENSLMYAARHPSNSVQLVQLLLTARPNVNLTTNDGTTALMLAAMQTNPNVDTITMLLGAGAEPRLRDRQGRTAFDILRTYGRGPTAQQAMRLLEAAEVQRDGQSASRAVPAPVRPPVAAAPAYSSPASTAAGPYGPFVGMWECRVDGFGGDGFTIRPDGSVTLAATTDVARAMPSGSTVRFEQPGDGFFYTRRVFQFALAGNELRGTRVETARDRPAQTSQYVCGRSNLDGSVPAGTNVSQFGPSQEAWKQVADAALAVLSTVANQASARNLQRAIQSGQIRDEQTLQAAMNLFLRDAQQDPEMRPIIEQLRRMLPEQSIGAGPQVRGDTVGSSSGASTGAASSRAQRRPAAGPPAGMPGGPAASQGPGSQVSRRDAQWRCGENSRCDAGEASVSIPEHSSGRLALVNTDNRRVANMDFFWDQSVESRSSRPDDRRYDVTLRMQAFNYSLCPVNLPGTIFVNGQIRAWFGSDAEPGLQLAVNQSITRTYTVRDVPQGATVVLRTATFMIASTCMP